MKLSLREIAEKSGVSASTVSRVINGHPGVANEIRERVQAVLFACRGREIGKSKSRQSRKNVGVLFLPDARTDSNIVIIKLMVLAEKLPEKWNLILLNRAITPLELETRFRRNELAGLLLTGHLVEPDLREVLVRLPHVWMNSYFTLDGETVTLGGNELAGRMAARYLLERGCERYGFLAVTSHNPGVTARYDGFRFELFSRDISCTRIEVELPEPVENCPSDKIETALEEMLAIHARKLPDGLFSPEDRLTAIFHRVLCKCGCCLPRMVSCNYTAEYLDGLYPRPASIDLGPALHAEQAMKELLRRINRQEKAADDIAVIVTPHLILGDE